MKLKDYKKKETGSGPPNPATLGHSIASYDQQGSHGELILVTLGPQWNIFIMNEIK